MLMNGQILQDVCKRVGATKINEAMKIVERQQVEIKRSFYIDSNTFELYGTVNETYQTYVKIYQGEINQFKCNCPNHQLNSVICQHIISTIMKFSENEERIEEEKVRKMRYPEFKQVIDVFYQEELKDIELSNMMWNEKNPNIKLEPKFVYDRHTKEIRLEFNIGKEQMYQLKNLPEFYDRIQKQEYYRYGKYLEFVHTEEAFEKESQELLNFLLRYAEVIKYVNTGSYSRFRYYGKGINDDYIMINQSGVDEIFNILKGRKVEYEKNYIKSKIELIDKEPQIEFTLRKLENEEYSLVPNIDVSKYYILKGNKYSYFLLENTLYRCGKDFVNHELKILNILKENYQSEVKFGKEDLKEFFSFITPKIRNTLILNDKSELEKYIPKSLKVKLYLDVDKAKNIIANIRFCYEKIEFNPLEDETLDIPRDVIHEAKTLNHFYQTGFMMDQENHRLVLTQEEKIYIFLTQELEEYQKQYEILITDDFKTKQIKQPKLASIGVKVENNLLKINLEELNIDKKELKEIMKQYRLKKKYYRLKDGTFLDLFHNSDIAFLDSLINHMDLSYKQLENTEITLPIHRSFYLNQLLEKLENTQIDIDDSYQNVVYKREKNEITIPNSMKPVLRYYQKIGYQWLKTIERYQFGGILADDMGLGKTIQVLTVLVSYIENIQEDNKQPSLVVSPSSLCLNWNNEIEKFAPHLRTLVIHGNTEERQQQISSIPKYDLVITSYDLLKRDLELYREKNYHFKYMIADEAQYIKNSNTQNSKAIKSIKADIRYALTGTPIENSLSELWSIFDYIMPGYLFSYRKFKEEYEIPIVKENDELAMKKLKSMIEPFVLRRTKPEVLTELPDKTITVLNNEMEGEQLRIYMTYLTQTKQEIKEELEINGLEKSHIKILSLLTRLRQICCYPGLFLSNYEGGSSKLNQCIEIIKEAIKGGHKVLLFSSYASMFEKIEEKLKKEKIIYSKLTGQTKVEDRLDLVDEFNKDENIKVFLISLKAGGTGLNLTGADMVIHYDPWWNVSAENQATDRTYRIGQKKNVQVYKLITKNSIEEKIYELQQRKANLIENMLSTQTTFINQLSKEDIMNLFE